MLLVASRWISGGEATLQLLGCAGASDVSLFVLSFALLVEGSGQGFSNIS